MKEQLQVLALQQLAAENQNEVFDAMTMTSCVCGGSEETT